MDINRARREINSLTEDRDKMAAGKIPGGQFAIDKVNRRIAELEHELENAGVAGPPQQSQVA